MAEQSTVIESIDSTTFRNVLGHFCSGITVVSSMHEGRPVGLTCQSFFSLSMDPALVAFSVGRTSTSFPAIRQQGSLVINILSDDQEHVSNGFARSGTDKWAGVSWTASERTGHPVIDGAVAFLECDIDEVIVAGDHLLVIAAVGYLAVHARVDNGSHMPLVYYQGRYSRLLSD